MRHWKWFMRVSDGPNGLLFSISMRDQGSQLDIWGDQEPTLPTGDLSEVEWLQWQVDEAKKGNRVRSCLPI